MLTRESHLAANMMEMTVFLATVQRVLYLQANAVDAAGPDQAFLIKSKPWQGKAYFLGAGLYDSESVWPSPSATVRSSGW